MNISAISYYQQSPSFGEIKLGRGGAVRLAKSMPVNDAKRLIRNNIFNKHDILITENATEVITPDNRTILRISKSLANSKEFTDVEVFEHDKRYVFQIKPGVSDADIDKYGTNNRDISLAEVITDIMNKNFKWKQFLRSGEIKSEDKLPQNITKTANEIELFSKICYSL